MKSVKNIFLSLSFLLVLHMNMHAQENPLLVLKTSSDKALLASNKKHELLQISKVPGSIKLNPFLKEKNVKQRAVAQIFSWDMKFKFRLSHNLNIIFSYN